MNVPIESQWSYSNSIKKDHFAAWRFFATCFHAVHVLFGGLGLRFRVNFGIWASFSVRVSKLLGGCPFHGRVERDEIPTRESPPKQSGTLPCEVGQLN